MSKILKRLFLILILFGSFIGTDMYVNYMNMKDPIYLSIKDLESDYNIDSIDAVVEDNYIIPGLNGVQIDVSKSFKKMKSKGVFQVSQLVFKEEKPHISATNYPKNIIIRGNPSKKGVSFVTMNESIANLLDSEVVPYAFLTTLNNYQDSYIYGTQINYEKIHFEELEDKLVKNKQNNNLCYYDDELYDICLSNGKRVFTKSIVMDKNYLLNYKKIQSGDIIFLGDSLSSNDLLFIIAEIRFRGLQILPLSLLLSEAR